MNPTKLFSVIKESKNIKQDIHLDKPDEIGFEIQKVEAKNFKQNAAHKKP